jgi:hypothetical protein
MRCAGRYFNALARLQREVRAGDLDRESARKDLEELSRLAVKVSLFLRTGQHALANDAEIVALEKMPAVIDPTSDTVFGMIGIDDVWGVLREGRLDKQHQQQEKSLHRISGSNAAACINEKMPSSLDSSLGQASSQRVSHTDRYIGDCRFGLPAGLLCTQCRVAIVSIDSEVIRRSPAEASWP